MVERFRKDWIGNARGIYYRHHYSPDWLVGNQTVWVPSLQGRQWDHATEEARRARAKQFVSHAIDNAKWRKSEFAWECDAMTDVFAPMRNDPMIALYASLVPTTSMPVAKYAN